MNGSTTRSVLAGFFVVAAVQVAPVLAATSFFDAFDTGPSALWGNETGAWSAAGGVYSATAPSNFPSAHSSLPFVLGDFVLELDIHDVDDGGVWLRSESAPGTAIGRTGVLLVTGAGASGLYWHIVTDGNSYGGALNVVSGLFARGVSDPHLRIEVAGDTYSVHVDGAALPATSLTTDLIAAGRVALYDFSGQTFDNVSLSPVPEPTTSALWLAGLGVVGWGARVLRCRGALPAA